LAVSLDLGFCFYETNVDTVKRAIESVKDHVRYIYAIDGKFEFFESDQLLSSREVRQYLDGIPNVILVDYPNRKENEKRQVYLNCCNEYLSDYLLILDADEYITKDTDWKTTYEFLEEKYKGSILPKIWGVEIRTNMDANTMKKNGFFPRIWQRPYLIQYTKTHNFWRFKTDGSLWKSMITFPKVPGIYMKGNDKMRDPEYVKKVYEYQLKLMEYEKPFKEEYRKTAKNVKVGPSDDTFYGIPMV